MAWPTTVRDAPEGSPLIDDLAHRLLTLSRHQLTLALCTLVTRDLVHHRTLLLERSVRQHRMATPAVITRRHAIAALLGVVVLALAALCVEHALSIRFGGILKPLHRKALLLQHRFEKRFVIADAVQRTVKAPAIAGRINRHLRHALFEKGGETQPACGG